MTSMSTDYSEVLPLPDFDRELGLDELLSGIDSKKLGDNLIGLLGSPARLVSVDDDVVFGGEIAAPLQREVITLELEPVAYLEMPEGVGERGKLAASLVETLLQRSARYLMASDIHLQIVQSDYEALRQKHAALMASERRYKELAGELEQRVDAQVATIKKAQHALYQAEKNASVGQLAAGVAHEINNPIGFVGSNLSTSRRYLDSLVAFYQKALQTKGGDEIASLWTGGEMDLLVEDFHDLLNESVDGVKRIATIIKDLKGFSCVDQAEDELADINNCIKNACTMIKKEIALDVSVTLELADLPSLQCHPGNISQMVFNILRNAGQACGKSGTIQVSSLLAADSVRVTITDSGSGVDEAISERIFEPFFTTREIGEGKGLGLTVSRDIAQSYGGDIVVESVPGSGATIAFWLPLQVQS